MTTTAVNLNASYVVSVEPTVTLNASYVVIVEPTVEPLTLNDFKRMFEQTLSNDMLRRSLDELRDWQPALESTAREIAEAAQAWRFPVQTS